jgi:hypothetical protein
MIVFQKKKKIIIILLIKIPESYYACEYNLSTEVINPCSDISLIRTDVQLMAEYQQETILCESIVPKYILSV